MGLSVAYKSSKGQREAASLLGRGGGVCLGSFFVCLSTQLFAIKRMVFKVDVSTHHRLNFSAFLLLYCSLTAAVKPAISP